MKIKLLAGATGAALLLSAAMPATAHGNEERFAESKYRHDVMEHLSYAIKGFLANAKGEVAHTDHIPALANIMSNAASISKDAFKKDTRGMEGKTDAKDEIWENWDDFAERMDKLEADTKAFSVVAAASQDMGEIMGAFKKVGSNCKSCHDKYKED